MSEGADFSELDTDIGYGPLDDFLGEYDENQETIDFSNTRESDRAPLGPLFSDGSFTSEEHRMREEHEVWASRRTKFRKNLDKLSHRHSNIFVQEKEDWERQLTNLEEDIEKLVDEYS